MQKVLKKLKNEKKYAHVMLDEGTELSGFVTDVDDETFIMALFEQVSEDDFVIIDCTFRHDLVGAINHDVSHRVDPEAWKQLEYSRDNIIYKPKRSAKQSVTKKAAKKANDTLTPGDQ